MPNNLERPPEGAPVSAPTFHLDTTGILDDMIILRMRVSLWPRCRCMQFTQEQGHACMLSLVNRAAREDRLDRDGNREGDRERGGGGERRKGSDGRLV